MNTTIIERYQQDAARRTYKYDRWLDRQAERIRTRASTCKHVVTLRENQAIENAAINVLTLSKMS